MKEGDKIIFLHKEFPYCGCSSEFNKLEIGKEYTFIQKSKYNFADRDGLGDVEVISLKDGSYGGWYPLSLFQPLPIKETIYEIY